MKKLVITGSALILACVLISGTIMAATGKIKIIVNGTEIQTDVAPKSDNGRVLVPISTIAKALGSNVQWDSKNRSVVIKSNTPVSEDIWPEEQDTNWIVESRDLIALFFVTFNSRKGDIHSFVTDRFDSDFVETKKIFPDNGLNRIIDYRIVDSTFIGTPDDPERNKVRVEVVMQTSPDSIKLNLEKLQLDFDLNRDPNYPAQGVAIDGIWVKEKVKLSSYTMFEGATFKELK